MKTLQLVSAILLLFLAATMFGCGGDAQSSGDNGGGAHNSSAATGNTGGLKIVRFGRGGDSVRLDPHTIDDGESVKAIINIFDTLVRFKDSSMELEPCLAERWEIDANGQEFTFHIRKGATFHDGTPVDAEAARYNLERLSKNTDMPAGVPGSPYSSLYEGIQSMTVVDSHTLTVRLFEPDVTFLINLAMFPASIVSPTAVKKDKDGFMHHPVGSGPFKFSSWAPGEKVVIEKNPDYWGSVPNIDKVIFVAAKESKSRIRNLIKGDYDIIDGIRAEDVPSLTKEGITVVEQPGMNVCYLALNNNIKKLQDPRVRQAIALAIDRDELNIIAYGNAAQPAYSPVPPTIEGAIAIKEFKEHDIEKAIRLLADAGYKKGELKLNLFQPVISRPYLPDAENTAKVIQSQLSNIGIVVEIVPNEWQTHLTKTKNAEHDMCLLGWSTDNGDPDNFLYTFFSKTMAVVGKAQNVSFYVDDGVEELLTRGRRTTDMAARKDIYKRVQEILGRDVPMIPLMHTRQLCAYRPVLKNFVLHPMELHRFYKCDLE